MRSIPACAGEPHPYGRKQELPPVYPRVRGGTMKEEIPEGSSKGLSPRARGNRCSSGSRRSRSRSIPACAGEPSIVASLMPSQGVYPRVRGGTLRHIGSNLLGSGLSPRARGNPIELAIAANPQRSIPACAGEPQLSTGFSTGSPVYPRVRGGTGAMAFARLRSNGLSPRARGNPSSHARIMPSTRSIPACAGEPD